MTPSMAGQATTYLYAGTGNDTLTGGEGDDTFVILEGTGGTTITDFNVSDDKIFVGALTTVPTLEQLLGKMTDVDTDNDSMADSVTIDLTDFGGGMVTLEGVTKSDLMDGAALNADLFDYGHGSIAGTIDAEYIIGGVGDDTMTGGGGADEFIFHDDHGTDTITDFSVADDKIDLSRLSTAITAEQLLGKLTDLADGDNDGTADGVTIDLTEFGGGTITLQGVTKADLMTGEALNTTLFMLPDGTAGTDDGTWSGTDDPDGVSGGEADLNFQAKAGGDAVWAGEGNDTVDGAAGGDWIFGEEGDDSIIGGTGDDTILGGEGNDSIDAGADNDRVYGGEGNDTIDGGEGNDWIRGDGGDDSIAGGAGDDSIGGNAGNDTIDGGAGADLIFGGEGDDSLTGGTEADTFAFGEGHGDDTITDFADGTDIIDLSDLDGVTSFSDLTIAADTNDANDTVITTGEGTITLTGVTHTDLDAGNFVFSTTGGSDNDTIDGGAGNDTIDGGEGNDSLTGGADADTFVFGESHGNDTITDFTDGEDMIDLSALTSITSVDDLTVTTSGNDVTIDTGEGTILLQNFSESDLGAEDFCFYEADPLMEGG